MKFIIKDSNKIDMHIHTTHSDGTFSVKEIIEQAAEKGLKYIAITDHNSEDARRHYNRREIYQKYNLKIIPGCELDVKYKGKHLHLLAYNYNSIFNKFIFTKLNKIDFYRGYVSLAEASKYIHLCGGIAILAHPFKYNHDGKEIVKEVVESGFIDGIECIHSHHTQEEIDYLLDICEKNNLIVSAGSDFHHVHQYIRGVPVMDNSLGNLETSKSTIEEQLVKAKQKYQNKRR